MKSMMKQWMVVLAWWLPTHASLAGALEERVWNHGSEDCKSNRDPPIEVFQFDAATYVLRQNKCVHFEAPFIYVLFGEHTVFVQDTGATPEPAQFPLYDVIHDLVAQREQAQPGKSLQILVTHSHSHGDHKAADAQFHGKPSVRLVEPTSEGVRSYFGLNDWPRGTAKVDLGGRELLVMPAPGHQEESIAVYDAQTGWLLTGDSVYPGRLYVYDWDAYRSSIHRLAQFAQAHPVSAVLGTHIEMSREPGKDFPMGSTFQPNEASLVLTAADLLRLDQRLARAGAESQKIVMDKFIVTPIGALQRALGRLLKWIGGP